MDFIYFSSADATLNAVGKRPGKTYLPVTKLKLIVKQIQYEVSTIVVQIVYCI